VAADRVAAGLALLADALDELVLDQGCE